MTYGDNNGESEWRLQRSQSRGPRDDRASCLGGNEEMAHYAINIDIKCNLVSLSIDLLYNSSAISYFTPHIMATNIPTLVR